jgi:UDP-GlcNAc:undecaprenyl-phosphate GlcNAc-1-phosphate transferase
MGLLQIISLYLSKAVFSFFLTVLFLISVHKIFPKLGFMDNPKKWGFKRDPIPYSVGIVVVIAFVVSVVTFVPVDFSLIMILGSAFLISVVGFIDDRIGLKPITRLFFQFLAGVFLVLSGVKLLSINFPFFWEIPFDQIQIYGFYLFSSLFLIFWTMLLINAMNFLDGIPGLNSTVTAIASFTIFFLSVHPGIHANPSGQIVTSYLSLKLGFSALALLCFDFPKPSVLMGDSGSTFFGFMLAVLSVLSGGKIATAFLVLGLPLLDLLWVVIRRTLEGKKFWQGDLYHLHHRFLYYGFSERQVVMIYGGISFLFGIFALLFVNASQKFFLLLGLLFLMGFLAFVLVFGKKFVKKKNGSGKTSDSQEKPRKNIA